MKQTDEIRETESSETEKSSKKPSAQPLFRRYQIKIKAGVQSGAMPTGEWPVGF